MWWKLFALIASIVALSWDDILEAAQDLLENGVSWGAIITTILLYNKLRNNKRFKEHDERVEAKQRKIMEHLGVEWDWDAEKKALQNSSVPMLYKWLHKGLYPARAAVLYMVRTGIRLLSWRGKRMKNVNYLSLIAAVIGALKIILQSFGIVIPDELANDVANGAAAVMTIIGIFMSHRKEVAPSGSNSIAESNK